jgi:hypothetical protein
MGKSDKETKDRISNKFTGLVDDRWCIPHTIIFIISVIKM